MPAPELGTKRQCPSCATRFYDLRKEPPLTCVKCGHFFEPELVVKTRKPRLIIKDDEADVREDDDPAVDTFDDAFAAAEDVFDDAGPEVRRTAREDGIVSDDDVDLPSDDELPEDLPDEDAESEIPPPPSASGKAAKKGRR